jgi:hypothetical protein
VSDDNLLAIKFFLGHWIAPLLPLSVIGFSENASIKHGPVEGRKQQIDEALKEGKTPYAIGKAISSMIERIFETKIPARTL